MFAIVSVSDEMENTELHIESSLVPCQNEEPTSHEYLIWPFLCSYKC